GSVDRSFKPGSTIDGEVFAIAALPDGRVYVGGGFSIVGGTVAQQLVRLSPDGSVDATFSSGSGFINQFGNGTSTPAYVSNLALQSDGRLLVGIPFANRINGVARQYF